MRWMLVTLLAGCTAEVSAWDVSDLEADADDGQQVADVSALVANNPDAPIPMADIATADLDGDGIPDATEELLLRRYRPFYHFTSGEDYRPADPVAELTNSQLRIAPFDDEGSSDPLPGCGRAGDHHLDPPSSLYTCRADTSFVVAQHKMNYCLNVANARYHGVGFDQARTEATGLYGHVAPTTINGHDAYKIEYWQFFAFNNQDITIFGLGSFGDHEGDWTSVQLWFDREEHRLVKVRYLIHGKQATFTIPPVAASCHDCTIDVKGPNYNPNPGNFLDNQAPYDDNAAQFYLDDHGYKHVVVYIERGAHEFWPGSWGHAQVSVGPFTFHLNPHTGDGPSYLVPDIQDRLFNMGEVVRPLTSAGKLILPYDGIWGCTNTREGGIVGPSRRSPVGPALHCSWKWPDRDPVAGCSG